MSNISIHRLTSQLISFVGALFVVGNLRRSKRRRILTTTTPMATPRIQMPIQRSIVPSSPLRQ